MIFDRLNFNVIDDRTPSDIIFNNGEIGKSKIYLSYSLMSDDITKGDFVPYSPYVDRQGDFEPYNGQYINKETGAVLSVEERNGDIYFDVDLDNENCSLWGLAFPFNFHGKMNGGHFQDQFLFNSPYVTNDRRFKSFYLTKPNGSNILVTVLGDCDGWKMDYSPFQGGQVFWALKILANFDKAYGNFKRNKHLTVVFSEVNDYNEALIKLNSLYNAPFIYPDITSGEFGTTINLKTFGICDRIEEIYKGNVRSLDFDGTYVINKEGEVELIPYYKDVKGAGITIYGYNDIVDLYIKTTDAVNVDDNFKDGDGNLCEWQCWASATLRLLINFKDRLTPQQIATYEGRLKDLYKKVMPEDETKAIPRLSILNKPYNGYPAYNIYKSARLQEQFFGTTLLLDSYKYFKDEKFLEYAIGSMDCLIDNYQLEDGRIQTHDEDSVYDYTTVCAPVIPMVDMALFLKETDKSRYDKYTNAARKVCSFLVKRGLYFPSEGGKVDKINDFLPDGSVANTILNILYYSNNIEKNSEFVDFAKKVMDLHDNYVIKTPRCQMLGSTIRWWETLWEGDKDGPAICCGHGWTIWRAEADWLYYLLTGNEEYKNKAINGFGTNLSKIDEKGNSYSLYQTDDIVGGGFVDNKKNIKYTLAPKFPKTRDSGLSRYVWIRINECMLKK